MSDHCCPAADLDANACWVASDLAPDGETYVLTIGVGRDRIFTPADPTAYALTVIRACAYAAYDAAVITQAVDGMGMPARLAAHLVSGLHAARPPLDDAPTAPLRFDPIVATRTRAPGVTAHLDGNPGTQWHWSTAEATGHAVHVLQAAAAVDLDAAYRKVLIEKVDIPPDMARATITDLGRHRHDHPPADQPKGTTG